MNRGTLGDSCTVVSVPDAAGVEGQRASGGPMRRGRRGRWFSHVETWSGAGRRPRFFFPED
jgi:hypothetical protein